MNPFVGAYADAHDHLDTRISELSSAIESPYPTLMRATVSEVGNMIRAIAGMVADPHPDLSSDGNFRKVMQRIDEAHSYTLAALNKQGSLLTQWDADLRTRENVTCGFDRISDDAKGIGDAFCAKPLNERVQDMMTRFLKDPVKGGMYLGIVERIDPYRSGVDPEMIQRARHDYVGIHQPKLALERERKGDIWEAAKESANLTTRVKASIAEPTRYAAIQNRTAKHSAADAAFLAALSRKAA